MLSSDRKSKALTRAGMICLFLGIVGTQLPTLLRVASNPATNWMHFFFGFLLGLSIVFNLAALIRRKRNRHASV